MEIKLYTHSGAAHADDVFAAAILQTAFEGNSIRVIRTRNPIELKQAAGMPLTFLLDVGGVYDPAELLFDHHQPQGAGYRQPDIKEWPYATAGLVWRHYGAQAVSQMHPSLTSVQVNEVVDAIDDQVLKYIDAVDCGIRFKSHGPSLSGIIASFNAASFETGEDSFPLVCDLARVLLKNFINRQVAKISAMVQVRNSAKLSQGRVLKLEACVPWVSVVADEMPGVKMVVYPVIQTDRHVWQMRVAVDTGPNGQNRLTLPANWGGLEHHALATATGVKDALFCHRSLHLAGAASFEGIISMAEKALAMHQDDRVALAA